ncbi:MULTISPECIES: PAS-domain containing protein [unclassified Roseovarius]|uniref:PAS-domain containing protein n=1 Tax=unclassified Roseovarius TaxID=2614913 RepID=UPI00273E37C6|nr:PAS-domain containing protein [Roseovarius sp. MMSF_3350]
MAGFTPLSLALALAASAVISLLVLWVLGRSWRAAAQDPPAPDKQAALSASFLFHDDELTHLDTRPDALSGLASGEIGQWSDLRHWLGNRFGPLPRSLTELEDGESRDLPATGNSDSASLTLSRHHGAERVEVTEPVAPGPLDRHRARRLDNAVARYQAVFDHAPCAVRMLDTAGQTIWENSAFADHPHSLAQRLVEASTGAGGATRVRVPSQDTPPDRIFEVEHVQTGDVRAVFATDVTRVAHAETVRREFIQTLTKIFAHLTTGLAIFDRNRQLALFNPALLDLTGLPAPLLSAQLPLMQFFDSLRDNRVLPEPKDYATWRKQIEDMITTAAGGLYLEDWHLPNGMTYRVTGRPHPDGAIAFLFEDITDNVSLTRHYNSQICLRDAVLDASDQAMVVFGPDNVLTLCNLACRQMLEVDPDASFADMTLRDFLAAGRKVLPGLDWSRIEQAVLARDAVKVTLTGQNGALLSCHVRHLPGNSAIITLSALGKVSRTAAKVSV